MSDDLNLPENKYIQFISDIIVTNNCTEIVELGTRTGKSSLWLKELHPECNITTYDNIYDKQTAKLLKAKNIRYVVANTRTVKHDHTKIDLLFCDTLHTAKQLIDEYNNFRTALHKDSVIIVDDVFLNDKAHGFKSIQGIQVVFGSPLRNSGFGLIECDNDGIWKESTLIVADSLPPLLINIYEVYVRLTEKIRGTK